MCMMWIRYVCDRLLHLLQSHAYSVLVVILQLLFLPTSLLLLFLYFYYQGAPRVPEAADRRGPQEAAASQGGLLRPECHETGHTVPESYPRGTR